MLEDTYGSATALGMSLDVLRRLFESHGCDRIFIKALAPNDNSKNQIYLASHPDQLRAIPKDDWELHELQSKKVNAVKEKILRAKVPFNWLQPDGSCAPAPGSNLIFYPQYPEVRFSGFLAGSAINASTWMQPQKQGRSYGRYLIWGVSARRESLGFLAVHGGQISNALTSRSNEPGFRAIGDAAKELTVLGSDPSVNARDKIIQNIKQIYSDNPHAGSKLKGGSISSYTKPNAGGFTLEALFGVEPNGDAAPDYMGWELKGHSGYVITLLTPEPDGGFYKQNGVGSFTQQYGYPDKSGIVGRLNFGGVHKVGFESPKTHLELKLFDSEFSQEGFPTIDGYLGLIDQDNNVAASWSYTKLLNHWQTKHANTVFVGFKRSADTFSFTHKISMGEGTSFSNLLRGLSDGAVYYDPGIKLEQDGVKIKTKARSQFRVNKKNLAPLFDKFTQVDVLEH